MHATPDRRRMQFDFNKKQCEDDLDFQELYMSEKTFRNTLGPEIKCVIEDSKTEYRENLV